MFRTVILVLTLMLWGVVAHAQSYSPAYGDASTETAATATEGSYTYEGLLALGHGKYVAQDYAAAITQYDQAKNSAPGRADAYYFIGCAMARQQRWEEAVTVLKSGATVAGEKEPVVHAKSLFVVATIW